MTKNKSVRPSKEDRVRLDRLYEEIVARLQESAMIVARTLGKSPPSSFGAATVTNGLRITNFPYAKPSDTRKAGKNIATPETIIMLPCDQGMCYQDGDGNSIGVDDEKTRTCHEM